MGKRIGPEYYDLTDKEHDRFERSYTKTGNGCWLWAGTRNPDPKNGDEGYGIFSVTRPVLGPEQLDEEGRAVKLLGKSHHIYAHRLSYILATGDVGVAVVRHICDNPPCMNPAHLIGGSQGDNIMDAALRGRLRPRGLVLTKRWAMERQTLNDQGLKRCGICTEARPLSDFHWSSKGFDGRQSYCRSCKSEDDRSRRFMANLEDLGILTDCA